MPIVTITARKPKTADFKAKVKKHRSYNPLSGDHLAAAERIVVGVHLFGDSYTKLVHME